MRKLIYFLLKKFGKHVILRAPYNVAAPGASFYALRFNTIDGKEFQFNTLQGKKVLLVNTASACGYTPQYQELQQAYLQHGNDLVILAFPSNDFGEQEKGSNSDIQHFCQNNFKISFPLFERSSVKGNETNPVYRWLTDPSKNGWNNQAPTWNFCKYLVSENGELLAYFSSGISPLSPELMKKNPIA